MVNAETVMVSVQSAAELAERLSQGRNALQTMTFPDRQEAMKHLADALDAAQDPILEANTLDLEASLEMAVPEIVMDWLRLTPDRLRTATTALRRLAALDLPPVLGRRVGTSGVIQGQWLAMGMVALVYEALPELGIVAAALCLHTGNGLLLKGGNEASQTNQAIATVFRQSLTQTGLPEALIQFVSPREGEAVRRWLLTAPGVDLLIPYGRPSLIHQVCREAQVPILAPAMGNCYLYWSPSGRPEAVATMILESHRGSPDPVNAIEKVLVDDRVPRTAIAAVVTQLAEADITVVEWPLGSTPVTTGEDPWRTATLQRQVILCPVLNMATAIAWINQYSSGHGDGIATESYSDSQKFARALRSTVVYVNASPCFRRNSPQASAIALGVAGQYGLFRGRITRDAFLALKTIHQGDL